MGTGFAKTRSTMAAGRTMSANDVVGMGPSSNASNRQRTNSQIGKGNSALAYLREVDDDLDDD